MKIRVTFNDGKKFSHYAFFAFKIAFQATYLTSGFIMFSVLYINVKNYIAENGRFFDELLCAYFGI
tara:strand:+ start:139 stop:336 length:198 start_codon:yes stop_codon:yes gene_type:complete